MAASTAFSVASGSPALVSTVRGDASRLASGNAFRTTHMVQFAPLSSMKRCNRVVATRATLSEASKSLGRDVIVSVLAAGAALGLSVSVVEGSFANPIDVAKSKATTSLKSAQESAPNLPSAPSPGGAIGDAQKGTENFASGIKGQFEGIFGKGKEGPVNRSDNTVASKTGGTGSALGDAQKRFSEFGKNPVAGNIEEASKNAEDTIARAKSQSQKPYGKRVGEAIESFQTKGGDAIGDETQGSVPSLPNFFPKIDTPKLPSLPTPDTSKLQDLNGGAQSKFEEAKGAFGSALPQ